LIDRAWYLFFVSLMNAATIVYDDQALAPSPESLISSYDAALQALAQNVNTQPLPVDLSAELTKQIEAAGLVNQSSALLSQIAEMQKQLEALNLLPPPTQGTVTAVTATAPVVSSGGTAPDISMPAASTSVSGYLTSTDWNTFNNKAPATSGTSILYGNGSGGFSNVTIGSGVTFAGGTLSATGSGGSVTSVGLSLPAEFTVTNSPVTSSGTLTATWASETAKYFFAAPNAANGTPSFRAIVASDIPALSYVSSVAGTSPISSSGGLTPTISISQASTSTNGYLSSTDWNTFNNKQPAGTYVTSVTGTSPVVSSGGTTPAISMAAASSSTNGYLTSTDWTTFNNKGSGTVTAVSVVSANGFAGTSSGGATPALTLTTSITGLLYGNGTALAAATISAPLSYSAGTLSIPVATSSANGYLSSTDWTTFNNKGSGTVTSVTGTAPVVSSGGATPAISMAAATTSVNGYLTSTDWNTFNNKQAVSAPVTKTADFTVAATDLWLINNKSGSTCTATLPAASSYSGRVLHFQNYQAQTLVSASSNVVPLAGGAAATSILLASAGDSATLVSDGSNWLMTQYVPNNILLLE
jgi:hypothetical protein